MGTADSYLAYNPAREQASTGTQSAFIDRTINYCTVSTHSSCIQCKIGHYQWYPPKTAFFAFPVIDYRLVPQLTFSMRFAHSIFVFFAFFLVLRTIFVCETERYFQHYLVKLIQQEARNACQSTIPRVFKSGVTLQLAFTTILESAAGIEHRKKSGTPLKPGISRFGRWIHTFRILALQ